MEARTDDLLTRIDIVAGCRSCSSTSTLPASVARESPRVLADGRSGNDDFDARALARWENEGGRSPPLGRDRR